MCNGVFQGMAAYTVVSGPNAHLVHAANTHCHGERGQNECGCTTATCTHITHAIHCAAVTTHIPTHHHQTDCNSPHMYCIWRPTCTQCCPKLTRSISNSLNGALQQQQNHQADSKAYATEDTQAAVRWPFPAAAAASQLHLPVGSLGLFLAWPHTINGSRAHTYSNG